MKDALLLAFQAVDRNSTRETFIGACRDLFLESHEYRHTKPPFSPSEVEAVTNGIAGYIMEPHVRVNRVIGVDVGRPSKEHFMDYDTYAQRKSEEMLYQNYSSQDEALNDEARRHALKVFLVAILFRYAYSIGSGMVAFPISALLCYFDGLGILLQKEGRLDGLSEALLATLKALNSVEPTWEDVKDVIDPVAERIFGEVHRLMDEQSEGPKGDATGSGSRD